MADSQSEEPVYESIFLFLSSFSFYPRCPSSLSSMNKYMAIDSGGSVSEWSSCINCSMAECLPKKSIWYMNEQVSQGVKCKSL